MNAAQWINGRRSVRSFDGNPLTELEQHAILEYAQQTITPYAQHIEWRVLDAKANGLPSPVITGAHTYLAGKMRRAAHAEEAFGYAFESVALFAASQGIGTTCIAGTMDRPAFERAMQLEEGEVMPCVTPLGHPAARMSLRESMMRKGVKADSRLPFDQLFFDGGLDTPLTAEKAGERAAVLELVRRAPSAVNRQPWRVVVSGDSVHFYEKQSKGFVDAKGWDIQKVDMGIALCHFACGCRDCGLEAAFTLEDPGLDHPADTVYIASFRLA